MKPSWKSCFEAAVAALRTKGVEPADLAKFMAYDVPAYGPRRPTRTRIPPEYLDWWPRADVAVLEAEIQHENFWVLRGFRASPQSFEVRQMLYRCGNEPEVVVAVWLGAALRLIVRRTKPRPGKALAPGVVSIAQGIADAADLCLLRARESRPWASATYVLPEQPEGFLAGVPADLDAVINVIVERVVAIHEKYVLVTMYPKDPVIPNPITELVALEALGELDDEQIDRVIDIEKARRAGKGEAS